MDPKYQEIIQKYLDAGYTTSQATIRANRELGGQVDPIELTSEVENLDYLKKKDEQQKLLDAEFGIGLTPTERALSPRTFTNTEWASSPIVENEKTKAPSVDQRLSIANNYKERLTRDTGAAIQRMIKEDPTLEAKLTRIETADESEDWKNYERNKLFGDRLTKEVKELQEQYAVEINEQLGDVYEGNFLGTSSSYKERLSEYLFKEHGLMIPLDGDQRYNESEYGGIAGWARDMFFGTSAAFMDFASGAVSSAGGALMNASTEGDDYDAAVMFLDGWMAEQAEILRAQQTHYENSVGESMAELRGFELLSRGTVGLSESIPYMIGIATPAGRVIQSLNAANNTLIDSMREDQDRINEGINPVFDESLVGQGGRLLYAAVDGYITGMSAKIEQRLAAGILRVGTQKAKDLTAEGVKKWFRTKGLDLAAEEALEVSQAMVEMGSKDVFGSEDFTAADYGNTAYDTALQTLITVGSPVAIEGIGRGVVGGVRGARDLTNSIEAALNSPAEKGRTRPVDDQQDPSGLNTTKDFDQMVGNFSDDMAQDKQVRRPLYRMLSVRHPEVMAQIGQIDRQLAVAIQAYKKASSKEGGSKEADQQKQKVMDLVRKREELIRPYETEDANLTPEESETIAHGDIAQAMKNLDNSVKFGAEAFKRAQVDVDSESTFNNDDLARLQDELASAKAKQAKARQLLGEYERAYQALQDARKNGDEEAISKAEDEARQKRDRLNNFLGLSVEDVTNQAKTAMKQAVDDEDAVQATYDPKTQLEAHNADPENRGSTFTPDGKNLIGQKKVSVSIFPERTKIIDGDPTEQDLNQFREDNKDLLEGNEDVLAIGTWFDPESGKTYLDISAAVAKEPGKKLGKQYNQKGVFDLETKETIDTGGTGEATGDMKAEADRVQDIRTLLGKQKKSAPVTKESDQAKKKADTKKSNLRGIEGQFNEISSKKDGSISMTPNKWLPAKVVRFINSKLMPTLRASFGSQGYKIVEHYTAESGDMANRDGSNPLAAYAVDNVNGPHEIHLNLPRLQALAESRGKTMEAVIVEEVYHLLLSRAIENAARSNPKAIDSLLNDMLRIAKTQGDANLVARVEAKMKAYREARTKDGKQLFTETTVKDEGIAEIVAEVVSYQLENESATQKFINEIRVAINKFMRNVVGRDALVISDVSSAQQIMGAFQEMVQTGRAVVVDTDPNADSSVERAAISPSKLPESEPFTLMYMRGGYDRTGGDIPVVPEIRTFNGKWNFINWWNGQRRPGSRVKYSGFRMYDVENQQAGEAVDADVMYNWKLKPPRNYKEEKKARRKAAFDSVLGAMDMLMGKGVSYGDAIGQVFDAYLDVLDPETREAVESDVESRADERFPHNYKRSFLENRAKPDLVEQAVEKVNEDNGMEADQVVERAYVKTVLDIKKPGKTQEDFQRMEDDRARAICGVGSGTCAANNRITLLQFVSSQLSHGLAKEPTFEESVNWAVDQLAYTKDYMTTVEGLDPTKTAEQFQEGKEALFEKLRNDPEVKVDPSDFDGAFALLVSYFSNGSVLDPNLHLASQAFRAGLIRVGSGSEATEFISPRRIREIQSGVADSFLPSVRGQRRRAVGSHLADINALIGRYTKDGKFDTQAFLEEARIRDDKNIPALASMVGQNSWKMAELTLGLLGDPKAIPMDTHMRDTYNLARGKYEGSNYTEGGELVIPQDVRLAAISKMKANGYDANPMMSDAQLFDITRKMKASGNESTIARGREIYSSLVGNVTQELRDMSASEVKEAREFVTAVAKKLGVTPFETQQLMYMNGVYAWSTFQNKPFVSDYNSGLRRASNKDLSTIAEDGTPGTQMEINFTGEVNERSAIEMPVPGKKFMGALSGKTQATENQLYRQRSVNQGTSVKVRGQQVKLDQDVVADALNTDATSKRIMAKGIEVQPGRKVGIRLNLNVMKKTGVPVQTVHEKTASGEALQYAGAVTVKNATLYVNPEARKKIATFQDNKFPMASVNGEFVSSDIEKVNYDGVRATFNPFLQGSFIDAAGRPIKSAEEATIIGGNVYLRGEIEYFDANDPVFKQAAKETPANKEKRTKRGPKYDKAVKRFSAYAQTQLGTKFETKQEAEAAYDAMDIENQTALEDSEVAANAEQAVERAAIGNWVEGKMREGAVRIGRTVKDLDIRGKIIADPKNYITPQNLKKLKRDVADLTDAELISLVSDTQLGSISQQNNNLSVLAQAEILSRAIARGETDSIPGIVAELASIGTTAGRLLRHLREVKGSTPKGMVSFIKAAVEDKGNTLSAEQEAKLEDISARMYEAHAIVEDLVTRASKGEEVGTELEDAIKRLKAIEREMDTFTNVVIERGWGDILGQLAMGNVLTTMSQATNVEANATNAFLTIMTEAAAAPMKWMGQALARMAGKELNFEKKQSLAAHLYAMTRMGEAMRQTREEVVTGQSQDVTEWTQARSLMPFRSLMAALSGDLPEKSSKLAAMNQRMKLFVQGTLGIPAEIMFRLLTLGDVPFRKYFENKSLYERGLALGLEGEALADFLKHPPREFAEKARKDGKSITFQEETVASKTAQRLVSSFERGIALLLGPIPGIDGDQFAKFMTRLMVPFRSTPANILYETATYASPLVGTARVAANIGKGNYDEAVHNMGKVIVGAVITETTLLLLKEGIISGIPDWDEDKERNLAYDQFPPGTVNVSALQRLINGESPAKREDDVFAGYMKLGTPGALMGATVRSYIPEDIRDREYGGPIDFAMYTIRDMFGVGPMAAASSMLQQSFLQGMNDFIQMLASGEYEANMENLGRGMTSVGLSVILPNQNSAVHRAVREYMPDRRVTKDMSMTERLMKNLEYTVKDRTFGGSEIPIRVDWKGNPIKQNPRGNVGWFYQLFDVTKLRQGEADAVSQEIFRLYEDTGEVSSVVSTPGFAKKRKQRTPKITSRKERVALRRTGRDYTFLDDEKFMEKSYYFNTEQINRLMAIAARERYEEVQALINSDRYRNMSDDERLKAFDKINRDFTSSKSYDGSSFKRHTIAFFDIMQEIYEDETRED